MDVLNYHHLRYFWMVAREGSVRRAAERLHVSQPTVSAQVRVLEDALGVKLFRKSARGLQLTEAGERVRRYSDEIFSLGDQLQASLRQPGDAAPLRVSIGITDSLPKYLSHAFIRPAFDLSPPPQVVCREGLATDLLARLASFRLDLVLADEPRKEGFKPKTIDDELNYVKTMVIKAFYNDIVSGEVLKTFQRVRHVLKKNANRRDRVLTKGEYERLLCASQKHLREILLTAYWTGMRRGEIVNLTWDKVDLKTRVICLEASDTKESKPKRVPIGTEPHALLEMIPRALHDAHVFLREGKQIGRYYTALTQASEKPGITCGQKGQGRLYVP